VGDTYITEYGDAEYHERYLNTMSLHQFENNLEERMVAFLADPERAQVKMMASHALYQRKFSRQAWEHQMQSVIARGFSELGMSPR
jgi:hypothetical protein